MRTFLAALTIALLGASLSSAQQQPSFPPQPAAQPLPSAQPPAGESLLIGPGDTVHVQVFDTPELDETVRVTDAGDMPLIVGGSIRVASLTPAEASRAVERALIQAQIMYQPRVLVSVASYGTQTVSVLGEVKKPGLFTITTPRSVLDLLAEAGGLTELADRRITIERHGTAQPASYYVQNNPADQAVQIQMTIYPGDRIVVPKAGIIYVLGNVLHAGAFPMTSNDSGLTVLEAIALAGGTAPSADPDSSKLIRRNPEGGTTGTPLKLSAMQKGKRPDLPLEASDVIYVPFSYVRNAALGVIGIAAAGFGALLYAF